MESHVYGQITVSIKHNVVPHRSCVKGWKSLRPLSTLSTGQPANRLEVKEVARCHQSADKYGQSTRRSGPSGTVGVGQPQASEAGNSTRRRAERRSSSPEPRKLHRRPAVAVGRERAKKEKTTRPDTINMRTNAPPEGPEAVEVAPCAAGHPKAGDSTPCSTGRRRACVPGPPGRSDPKPLGTMIMPHSAKKTSGQIAVYGSSVFVTE